MADTTKKAGRSVAPYYGVAAVWLVYALLFDLYKFSHFAMVIVLSAAVGLLLNAIVQPEEAAGSPSEKPQEPAKPVSTGNAELDKMIRDGELAIAEMKRLEDSIVDEKISADIRQLESISAKIFEQVKAQTEKLSQIRRFMDYYLPTTLKLLNAYDRMASTGVSGENIDGTKARVEQMMGTITAAFEKQLDSLFGADALDISTDITVLETMMAREGLTDEKPLEAQTTENTDLPDIKLEL